VGAYYNEIDPYAAAWLRNLIAAGHLPDGEVDTRSILDVSPEDLSAFDQCHFFAGIGGWAHALRLAEWPDTRGVWTGSCPCQPFSVAGRGDGMRDERHLWPYWFALIEERRPRVIFGEQVESATRHGWLDLVCSDLEGIGYAVGAVGVPAAGIGAPHIRQRSWFVADNIGDGLESLFDGRAAAGPVGRRGEACGVADDDDNAGRREQWVAELLDGVGSAHRDNADGRGATFWTDADWIYCRDEKYRPVEPGTFPLAHGVLNRVGRLRAYGNAIVPQVAAEVIRAFLEVRP